MLFPSPITVVLLMDQPHDIYEDKTTPSSRKSSILYPRAATEHSTRRMGRPVPEKPIIHIVGSAKEVEGDTGFVPEHEPRHQDIMAGYISPIAERELRVRKPTKVTAARDSPIVHAKAPGASQSARLILYGPSEAQVSPDLDLQFIDAPRSAEARNKSLIRENKTLLCRSSALQMNCEDLTKYVESLLMQRHSNEQKYELAVRNAMEENRRKDSIISEFKNDLEVSSEIIQNFLGKGHAHELTTTSLRLDLKVAYEKLERLQEASRAMREEEIASENIRTERLIREVAKAKEESEQTLLELKDLQDSQMNNELIQHSLYCRLQEDNREAKVIIHHIESKINRLHKLLGLRRDEGDTIKSQRSQLRGNNSIKQPGHSQPIIQHRMRFKPKVPSPEGLTCPTEGKAIDYDTQPAFTVCENQISMGGNTPSYPTKDRYPRNIGFDSARFEEKILASPYTLNSTSIRGKLPTNGSSTRWTTQRMSHHPARWSGRPTISAKQPTSSPNSDNIQAISTFESIVE